MKSKSTKDNRYRHFNRQWFKDNQAILLWLLNAPMIRRWFSWVLRIHKDRPFDKKIIAIEPHCYTWDNGKDLTTDFRTHNKFSKRIYFSFKYLWLTLHALDQILKPIPQFNFGFDTLTVYPDPDPETDTVDGYVYDHGTPFSSAVSGSGFAAVDVDTSGAVIISTVDMSTDYWEIYREIFLFKTSSLTAGASISSAVISLYGQDKADNLSCTPNLNIYSSNPASNTVLDGGDYDSLGSTEFSSSIAYEDWSVVAYNDFSLNASGKSAISKTGISKFGARNANYDVANSAPSWDSQKLSWLIWYSADTADTTSDPKLVVTYTTGGGVVNNLVSNII